MINVYLHTFLSHFFDVFEVLASENLVFIGFMLVIIEFESWLADER